MIAERQSLVDDILTAQHTIMRALSASAPSVWVNLDLSMAQLKTLMALYHRGALPIGQIAENLGIGQPTASHLVDKLVQTQLVNRTEDPIDRRRTLAALAPAGQDIAQQITQVRVEIMQHWLDQLDDETLAAFHRGLCALATVSAAEAAPAPEAE